MKSTLLLLVATLLGSSLLCRAQAPLNLVPDASFEAPVYSFFSEEGKGNYFAAKEKVAGATDGNFVLALQGWENAGSQVLSLPFDLTSDTYSATWKAHSFGNASGAGVELALFDEAGKQQLASLGKFSLNNNGQWSEIKANGVKLSTPAARGRLAFLVSGPQEGARLEIDQLGLFAGSTTGTVTDNTDFAWFEAEELANGKNWEAGGHFNSWYPDLPSGMKMLVGVGAVVEADNSPVTKTLTIHAAGRHRLWLRLLHIASSIGGTYTIALRQNGQTVASREINDGDAQFGKPYNWVWTSLDADLQKGEVEVVLTRPPGGVSWVARRLDLFALTNLLDYKPQIQDFRPRGFLRFTNTSTGVEPYVLLVSVHRLQGPVYYVVPGVLSNSGWSGSFYAPTDKTKWLSPGESTPWVNISQFLLPGGGRNIIGIDATRYMHTAGLLESGFKGTLEFAVGSDKHVARKIEINQSAPQFLMTLPYDMENDSDQILTAADYLQKVEAVLDKIGTPTGRAARYLDLNAILALNAKVDDPKIIEREINVLKRLGFNGTYMPLTDPKDAVAFNTQHGLENHLGLWINGLGWYKNNCPNQPDTEKLESLYKGQAEKFAPMMTKVERMKLSDEPSGPSYAHFVSCDFCKNKFRNDLKAQGLTPAELGVASWDEVLPVLPADKEKHPALFYYTGLFRLQTFADWAKATVTAKKKYLPDNVKTYVNYSPPLSEQMTWTQRGNDLWLTQRDGGLEMGWTEDWAGYGLSPQQISPIYAQLRAAGAPTNEPLGGYMVAVSGGPLLQRIKYYEMVAGGARHINVYAYGPYYATVDSWGANYDIYPVISQVQHELGNIDEVLHSATRHKTDVAILYNRTAGIWLDNMSTSEQDARYLHFALAHAGYDADFIDENDVVAGKLANYKVLYLNGQQIRRDAAAKIVGWAQSGGVLCGTAGAGTRDEYNRPLNTFNTVFGAQSQNLKLENDAGRPKYELRALPILDELTTAEGSGAPPVTFNQLSYRETLLPAADAKVILKNKKGEATGVLHSFGKGTAIRLAAAPGITYLNDAVRGKDYDADSYLPKKYNKALRDFIAWPAMLAKAFRVAHASTPITEITRYDGKTGNKANALFFVIDHNAEPNPNFSMTLPQTAQFSKARTASGKPVTLKKIGDALQVAFALDVTDAVVLE
jgi:hypothetical protein